MFILAVLLRKYQFPFYDLYSFKIVLLIIIIKGISRSNIPSPKQRKHIDTIYFMVRKPGSRNRSQGGYNIHGTQKPVVNASLCNFSGPRNNAGDACTALPTGTFSLPQPDGRSADRNSIV